MPLTREFYEDELKMLSVAVGINAGLFDVSGSMIYMTDGAPGCALCRTAQASAACRAQCDQFHRRAGVTAFNTGDVCISRCPVGAVALTVPVMEGNRFVGAAAYLPLRMWEWDELAVKELLESARAVGLEAARLIDEGGKLPEVDVPRAKALMRILRDIVLPDAGELEIKRTLSEQQGRISELVYELKMADASEKSSPRASAYPIHIEREMLARVRMGDKNGARAMLNELLGHIFYRTPGKIELIKARVLELVVMISRAAVEAGAEMDALLGMNYNFIAELSLVSEYEELCAWVVKVLDSFLETVYQSLVAGDSGQLSDAIACIRLRYAESLSLEEVAREAHVSPYYLSHMFKDKLGVTFVEYLTQVRVSMAKNFLLHTRLPVSAVAERVGYEDAGYFGKVFRKCTGVTPKAFRNGA